MNLALQSTHIYVKIRSSLHFTRVVENQTTLLSRAGLFKAGFDANLGLVSIFNSILWLNDSDSCRFVLSKILTVAAFKGKLANPPNTSVYTSTDNLSQTIFNIVKGEGREGRERAN